MSVVPHPWSCPRTLCKALFMNIPGIRRHLVYYCWFILLAMFLLCAIHCKFLSKQSSPKHLLNISDDWSRTNDARIQCLKEQWHVSPFYNNGSISCDPTKCVSFDEATGDFTESKQAPASYVRCPRYPVSAPFRLPKTGLVSWPGSGNTWMRHILQQLTGIQTGAVYYAPSLLGDGFPGEGKKGNVVVIKTHFTAIENTRVVAFHRQIMIIRNPYNAFVSEYKRGQMRAGHTGHVNISVSEEWLSYVVNNIREWSYFIRVGLDFPYPQLIVLYEDMKDCLLREILNIAAFLRTAKLNKFSVCCALTNSKGRNYRNQTQPDLRRLYPMELRVHINRMLTILSKDIAGTFPVLAQRLLNYRILTDS